MRRLIEKYFVKFKDTIISRGQSRVLIRNDCTLDGQKYGFSHRIVNLLNKLPDSCVNATSVNMSKNRRVSCFQGAGYI